MIKNIVIGAIVPLVLVVCGIALLVFLQAPEPPTITQPDYTPTALLEYLPITEVEEVYALADKSETLDISVNGTVVPYRELQLAAESAGRITEKDPTVRSGNFVKKGQVLYKIDPRDYKLEIERLSRRRDQELASIEELKLDIQNAEAILDVAEEELKLAEKEVARFEKLGANYSSDAELDTARKSRLASMNQMVTLKNQLSKLRQSEIRAELSARLAETELEQAELNLERTIIRAPVDGRVVSEEVEVDSYVQRGTALVVIEDTEKVEVACNIRMDQLQWILDKADASADPLMNVAQAARYDLPATPVEIRFEAGGRDSMAFTWQGVLDRFDGAGLDPQSRTVPILVRVDAPSDFKSASGEDVVVGGPPMLVRGMFVDVSIKAKPSTQLMLVPKLSIKPATNGNEIWKFTQNKDAWQSSSTAKLSKAASESGSKSDGSTAQDSEAGENATDKTEESEKKLTVRPEDWVTGYLEIIEDVRMVSAYWGSDEVEYWICEVPKGRLQKGDLVVVTPLPGIKADGTDAVRYRKANTEQVDAPDSGSTGDLADTNEGMSKS